MSVATRTATFCVLAILAGCATTGANGYANSAVPLAPGQVSIVVYRWNSFKGAAWTHRVFIDGRHVADLRNSEFTRIAAAPGKHHLSTGTLSHPDVLAVDLEISPGHPVFVEDRPGNAFEPDRLRVVDQAKAEKILNSGYTYHAPLAAQ